MNIKRSLTLPLAAAAVIASGLALGAALPTYQGVEPPTPTATAPFTLPPVLAAAVQCEEDEPCWDCETMGNRICGIPTETMRHIAWQAFDAAGGAEYLLVDKHKRVTLTGYSLVDPYEEDTLTVHQLALHESGNWYIFTAEAV